MNYFIYNGISSKDMGVRISSKDIFSAPKYDLKFQSIPGRDGDLITPRADTQTPRFLILVLSRQKA